MRIADAYGGGRPVFSFEFFPPRNEEQKARLLATIDTLRPLHPDFVSVTYGAGGSTRQLTIDTVSEIKREHGLEAMAHLTCVGHTADEIAHILDRLEASGIENVIALRGDPPKGQAAFTAVEGGFAHGSELAAFVRSRWPFCVAGAAYPEGHPDSPDRAQDVAYAKLKEDVGVEVLITNLFFEPDDYFTFVRRARNAGVTIPIVPGVMPITTLRQLEPTGMFARSGARVPDRLRRLIEASPDSLVATGISWAISQCRALLEGGAPGVHFYTLNHSRSSYAVYQALKAALPAVRARAAR
jgi:methylenetetrahydrofolate reductase (NADH)